MKLFSCEILFGNIVMVVSYILRVPSINERIVEYDWTLKYLVSEIIVSFPLFSILTSVDLDRISFPFTRVYI